MIRKKVNKSLVRFFSNEMHSTVAAHNLMSLAYLLFVVVGVWNEFWTMDFETRLLLQSGVFKMTAMFLFIEFIFWRMRVVPLACRRINKDYKGHKAIVTFVLFNALDVILILFCSLVYFNYEVYSRVYIYNSLLMLFGVFVVICFSLIWNYGTSCMRAIAQACRKIFR